MEKEEEEDEEDEDEIQHLFTIFKKKLIKTINASFVRKQTLLHLSQHLSFIWLVGMKKKRVTRKKKMKFEETKPDL